MIIIIISHIPFLDIAENCIEEQHHFLFISVYSSLLSFAWL